MIIQDFTHFVHQETISPKILQLLHRGAIWQFPVRWIYYWHSCNSTRKKTGKTHLWSFLFETIDGMMRRSHRKLLSLNLQILLKLLIKSWSNIGIESACEIIIEYSYFNLNLWKVLSYLQMKSKYTIFNCKFVLHNFWQHVISKDSIPWLTANMRKNLQKTLANWYLVFFTKYLVNIPKFTKYLVNSYHQKGVKHYGFTNWYQMTSI